MSDHQPVSGRDRVRILDPEKVRVRRVESGISELELGSMLGAAVWVTRALERGADQCHLDLRFVRDLARALGTDVDDLLESSTAAQHHTVGSVEDVADPNDASAVGALLAETQELMAVDTIAWALGWTSARTLLALDELEQRLASVGQRLQWLQDSMVGVAACRLYDEVLHAAASRSIATDGISPREASVLARMLERSHHRMRDIPKITLRRFRRAGFFDTGVVENADERKEAGRNCEGARLTEYARYNLVLDT